MIRDLYAETEPLLAAAQCKDGVPPKMRLTPYRNIRDLLSMHAKTSPEKTFIIFYDDDEGRESLTYAEFNARVHQAANFMAEDLGVRRGDRVATMAYNHLDAVLIYFACWVIGAAVAPQNVAEDDKRIAFILRDSQAKVCFVRGDYIDRAQSIIPGTRGRAEYPAHHPGRR